MKMSATFPSVTIDPVATGFFFLPPSGVPEASDSPFPFREGFTHSGSALLAS